MWVPNLQFANNAPLAGNNNSSQVFIRSIGQTDPTATVDPGVGIYIDDVYMGQSVGGSMDFRDIAGVQVLRGPTESPISPPSAKICIVHPHTFYGGSITMIREAKIVLVITVALWGLMGAFGNLTDWDETMGGVGAVTSMAGFEGGAESWKATSNPAVLWLGALFIMLSKLAAAGMCGMGAQRMWQARGADAAAFTAAKQIALAGCAVAVIMLFGGFIVIAETWFELWRSEAMRDPVLQTAFRYGGMIALIAIFVGMKDD